MKTKIKVTEVTVEVEPTLKVYQVELTKDNGTWLESFGTMTLLLAFLRGLRVATTMGAANSMTMDDHWEFDEHSRINMLP
jgi:hypothetical protein